MDDEEKRLEEVRESLLERDCEDSILLENPSFVEAIIGEVDGHVVYSYDIMVKSLAKSYMKEGNDGRGSGNGSYGVDILQHYPSHPLYEIGRERAIHTISDLLNHKGKGTEIPCPIFFFCPKGRILRTFPLDWTEIERSVYNFCTISVWVLYEFYIIKI